MDVTISIDDRLLRRDGAVTRGRGRSSSALVRAYLETLREVRDIEPTSERPEGGEAAQERRGRRRDP